MFSIVKKLPTVEGTLLKKSTSKIGVTKILTIGIKNSWKKKYCKIENCIFTYYKNKDRLRYKPFGIINFQQVEIKYAWE